MTSRDYITQGTLDCSTSAPLKLNEVENGIDWLMHIETTNKQTQRDPGSHMMWLGIFSLSFSGLCLLSPAPSGSCSVTLSSSTSASLNVIDPSAVTPPSLNQSLFLLSHVWVGCLTWTSHRNSEWGRTIPHRKTWELLEKRVEGC